jgi:hypothetical protein
VDDQDDDRYSRAPEPGDVVRICRALNEAGARYLLIGGFALASPATLIKLKNTARPQDALDRSFLEGVLEERSSRRPRPQGPRITGPGACGTGPP